MTEYKHTSYLVIASLLKYHPELIDSVENFISKLKKDADNNLTSPEIDYESLFDGFLRHLFNHHSELKDRAAFYMLNNSSKENRLSLQIKYVLAKWSERNYALPIPFPVKRLVLEQNKIENAIWIETGTALGDTTIFLSQLARTVYSIEPSNEFYKTALERFKNSNNVKIIKGTSEEVLPGLLKTIEGDVCFFLDGHYSGEGTYLGEKPCALIDELFLIGKNLNHFKKIMVAVDDLHGCYGIPYESYPSLNYLISWADFNNLTWHIEHNMFIARN